MNLFNRQYNKLTDEELMKAFSRGGRKAFDVIYNRYSDKILNFIYRLLGFDYDKAQDFLQEVFLVVIEKPAMFNIEKKFSTWLYSIALNLCRNEFKRTARFESFQEEHNDTISTEIDDISIDMAEFDRLLEKELQSMDINHKSVFILRYKEEMSLKEIAEIMNCPVGTVKSRIFYALKCLSEKLYMFNPKVSKEPWKTN